MPARQRLTAETDAESFFQSTRRRSACWIAITLLADGVIELMPGRLVEKYRHSWPPDRERWPHCFCQHDSLEVGHWRAWPFLVAAAANPADQEMRERCVSNAGHPAPYW